MIARTLAAAAFVLVAGIGAASATEWFVVSSENETCAVVDEVLPGFGKLAGPYATQAEAIAEQGRIARCDEANTDPDPDEDGPAR